MELTREEMLQALTNSGNTLVAEKCKKIINGTINPKKEIKTCGSFMFAVLSGNYDEAMDRADFDNRLCLEIAVKKKELKS
jgi:hypothetical protein